ncbi:MAG: hypothetical protein EXR46_00205 [Dehalococcoidia bacterium]|nr:hypothetical protein [Dehalococcoidia bacterium]
MDLAKITGIVGAFGAAIAAVPIVVRWLSSARITERDNRAIKHMVPMPGVDCRMSFGYRMPFVGRRNPDRTWRFQMPNGDYRCYVLTPESIEIMEESERHQPIVLAKRTFRHPYEFEEAVRAYQKARNIFVHSESRGTEDKQALNSLLAYLAPTVKNGKFTRVNRSKQAPGHPFASRDREAWIGHHRHLLSNLPSEARQFSEGFLEDGVEHLTLAGEPLRPFILKETRDITFWILKLRLFKFARSRRRQVL